MARIEIDPINDKHFKVRYRCDCGNVISNIIYSQFMFQIDMVQLRLCKTCSEKSWYELGFKQK